MSGQVRPLGWRSCLAALGGGTVLVWSVAGLVESAGASLPDLPLAAPVVLLVVAVVVGWLAVRTFRSVRRLPSGTVSASAGVARLSLARASILAGAALAGGYGALALRAGFNLEAEAPRSRFVSALLAAVASALLLAAGAALQRACRKPPSTDDTPQEKE